jgi:hypothetical protein
VAHQVPAPDTSESSYRPRIDSPKGLALFVLRAPWPGECDELGSGGIPNGMIRGRAAQSTPLTRASASSVRLSFSRWTQRARSMNKPSLAIGRSALAEGDWIDAVIGACAGRELRAQTPIAWLSVQWRDELATIQFRSDREQVSRLTPAAPKRTEAVRVGLPSVRSGASYWSCAGGSSGFHCWLWVCAISFRGGAERIQILSRGA